MLRSRTQETSLLALFAKVSLSWLLIEFKNNNNKDEDTSQ